MTVGLESPSGVAGLLARCKALAPFPTGCARTRCVEGRWEGKRRHDERRWTTSAWMTRSGSSAELLHQLMLPDLERVERIGAFWSYPQSRSFAELLIDGEEDRTLRAVLVGMLREADSRRAGPKTGLSEVNRPRPGVRTYVPTMVISTVQSSTSLLKQTMETESSGMASGREMV